MCYSHLQVIVADESLVSESQSVIIAIQLENDEPPIISDTPNTQIFIEEGGPIDLFNFMVTISDADNCFDHGLVEEIRVTFLNPVEAEDELLVNGSALPRFDISFSCDEEEEPACYEDFLLSLQYNNTNREPGTFAIQRRFMIEVCMHRVTISSPCNQGATPSNPDPRNVATLALRALAHGRLSVNPGLK